MALVLVVALAATGGPALAAARACALCTTGMRMAVPMACCTHACAVRCAERPDPPRAAVTTPADVAPRPAVTASAGPSLGDPPPTRAAAPRPQAHAGRHGLALRATLRL